MIKYLLHTSQFRSLVQLKYDHWSHHMKKQKQQNAVTLGEVRHARVAFLIESPTPYHGKNWCFWARNHATFVWMIHEQMYIKFFSLLVQVSHFQNLERRKKQVFTTLVRPRNHRCLKTTGKTLFGNPSRIPNSDSKGMPIASMKSSKLLLLTSANITPEWQCGTLL